MSLGDDPRHGARGERPTPPVGPTHERPRRSDTCSNPDSGGSADHETAAPTASGRRTAAIPIPAAAQSTSNCTHRIGRRFCSSPATSDASTFSAWCQTTKGAATPKEPRDCRESVPRGRRCPGSPSGPALAGSLVSRSPSRARRTQWPPAGTVSVGYHCEGTGHARGPVVQRPGRAQAPWHTGPVVRRDPDAHRGRRVRGGLANPDQRRPAPICRTRAQQRGGNPGDGWASGTPTKRFQTTSTPGAGPGVLIRGEDCHSGLTSC